MDSELGTRNSEPTSLGRVAERKTLQNGMHGTGGLEGTLIEIEMVDPERHSGDLEFTGEPVLKAGEVPSRLETHQGQVPSVLSPLSLETEGSQSIFERTLQADECRRPLKAHKNDSDCAAAQSLSFLQFP